MIFDTPAGRYKHIIEFSCTHHAVRATIRRFYLNLTTKHGYTGNIMDYYSVSKAVADFKKKFDNGI